MFKIIWGALFGNPLYAALGFGAVLLVSSGFVGVKAYQFGANAERVNCQVRIDDIKAQIDAANAKIKKINDQWKADFEKIEAERDAETRKADEAEALANAAIGEYQDELAKRPADSCLPSDDDVRWLQ